MDMVMLGLDMGVSSVGWALIDEGNKRIIATGVRVFPEGVDRDQQGGEKSKNETRRTARGARRQLARRARRKRQLRGILSDAGLLPDDPERLAQVLAANPYELRRRGLDEPLTPHEFGRAILHLGQRRGFLSNRKTDKVRAKETGDMKAEINALAGAIDASGCRTLGEYLSKLGAEHKPTEVVEVDQRVRRRHTRRDMYEHEFASLWDAQQRYHKERLCEELRQRVHRTIFYQRAMYWPKTMIGRCELEPKAKRCASADRAAQRFRMLQEVNNVRLLDTAAHSERELTPEERQTLLGYLATAKQRTFDQIRKKLGFSEAIRFNYERAERTKLKGHETDAAFGAKKVLGKDWFGLSDQQRDAVVTIVHDEPNEAEALRGLVEDCGLTPEQARRAAGVHLGEGRMSYSREAIDKLLPHLERGLLLMGDDETNSALHAAGYLRPDQREVRQRAQLPPAPDLPNPIVRQGLVEVRKVVNAVIGEYGMPVRVHVELARDAKRSLEGRRELLIDNAKRRRAREAAAEAIEEFGVKATRATINKYLLWVEQGGDCAYSGQTISPQMLLSDQTDVDHILPRWRSLDDSMANKVVCLASENAAKGDQTPREWLADSDPEKYARVLQVAKRLRYNKQRKFIQADIQLDDFVARQLTDTSYISRAVTQYLRCLGASVVCPRGQMTAELRYRWGLTTILNPDGDGKKNRADHRHHAIYAIVIAMTSPARLHALASARGKNVAGPWEGFRADVEASVGAINVTHRVRRRVTGALHEATIYGTTCKAQDNEASAGRARGWAKDWVESPEVYVRRKPVTDLTDTKHLDKIRDPAIRRILAEHLRSRGIDPDRAGKIPGEALKGDGAPRMPSGVPIRRVRMLEESKTFRPVSTRRPGQHVKPGNNHHIVYRAVEINGQTRWQGEVVTMWDAARRGRNGQPLVDRGDRDGAKFVMSLSINEAFLIDGDGGPQLCIVRKLDQRSGRLHYKLHTDARQSGEINRDNLSLSANALRAANARKVAIDPLGRLRNASD